MTSASRCGLSITTSEPETMSARDTFRERRLALMLLIGRQRKPRQIGLDQFVADNEWTPPKRRSWLRTCCGRAS
jgi:hypothetical protein